MQLETNPWAQYTLLERLGQGAHGVIHKIQDKVTGEFYACKLLERQELSETVRRELVNHRTLPPHPNIIGFKEVFLTRDKLGIVLEFANGGELFRRVQRATRFSEDQARFFFQQLVTGVSHLHRSGVCHRDIKLENCLIRIVKNAGQDVPVLKIADFGFSKSHIHQFSLPHSRVGTTSYVAPEVIKAREGENYDGQVADVWSCGVQLYVMLVGRYPFDDPNDPANGTLEGTVRNIVTGSYRVPPELGLSPLVLDLLQRMLKPSPMSRIRLNAIHTHPWFLDKLPDEIRDNYPPGCGFDPFPQSAQSDAQIEAIIRTARGRS